MKKIITILFILIVTTSLSQYNCKKSIEKDGSTVTKCFHTNGKLSTIETWDKNRRSGTLKAFDNNGKEIINYSLRKFAGHASVYLQYYKNGQISQAEYSSAPDGGIQFYHIIHKFNEQGFQTEYYDYSQPDGHPVLTMPKHLKKDLDNITALKDTISKLNTCAVIHITQGKIINETNKAVSVVVKGLKNTYISLCDTILTIAPHNFFITKPTVLAQGYLSLQEFYAITIQNSKKQKNKFKIINGLPIEESQKKIYSWHIITK